MNPIPQSTETMTNGQYPVSIGTSLALETLFGINENIKPTNPLPYTRYKVIMINVRTLLRNIVGAVNKELKVTWSESHYYEKLIEELNLIPEIINDQSHSKLQVGFYYLTYDSLSKKYPNAILKNSKSSSSLKSEVLENYALHRLKDLVQKKELRMFIGDLDVPLPEDSKSLLMTHMPVDLLPYSQSSRCDLIESHTGVIKDRYLWYTKLSGKGLERIPFTRKTIQIFGDGKLFLGIPPSQRKLIIDFAEKNRWNQSITDRLIDKQMDRFPNQEVAKLVKSL